jgi:P4 family phage/plasmid primase-like protien
MICFTEGEAEQVYMCNKAGIWENLLSRHKLSNEINKRREVLEVLRKDLKGAILNFTEDNERTRGEAHVKVLQNLISRLYSESFKKALMNEMVLYRMRQLEMNGQSTYMFDSKKDCIGFTDGVYNVLEKRLMTGKEACEYMVSNTVGYDYVDPSPECCGACEDFLAQIFPNQNVKKYILKKISNAVRGINDQLVMFHYNVSGSNGKSTFFNLCKVALGGLFMKCKTDVLYAKKQVNSSGANEEVMSIKGRRIVLFSEPTVSNKLDMSFLKDLTGGEEQSARALYGHKQTFVFNGLVNIVCNKLPEMDDIDGGGIRRIRCVPYESTFVKDESKVDPSKNVYLTDQNVDDNFQDWKHALIKMLIDIADEEVPEPDEVKLNTSIYVERENVTLEFYNRCIVKTDDPDDRIQLRQVYMEYQQFCRDQGLSFLKQKFFKEEMIAIIGSPQNYKNVSNFWKGYKMVNSAEV